MSTTTDLPNLGVMLAFVREVALAIGAGSRIGQNFLQTAEQVVRLKIWQHQRIVRLVITKLFGTVSGKRIGVLGFAFKADTNDTRESPAIRICRDPLEEGAILQIIDPNVSERQMALDLGQAPGAGEGSWQQVADVHQAASGAEALLLLTEWNQFAQIDWPAVAALMRQPAWLFDARDMADGVCRGGADGGCTGVDRGGCRLKTKMNTLFKSGIDEFPGRSPRQTSRPHRHSWKHSGRPRAHHTPTFL